MPSNVDVIESMSWDYLKAMAFKALSTIPVNERIVFENDFGLKWPKFKKMILSLTEKSHDEIAPIRYKVSILGDLSQGEVLELSKLATSNTISKSPKIEYWQICKLLYTKSHK